MNSWPSVLPTEPDLTWHSSDMCNFYYELSIQRSGFEWHYLYSDASPFPPWLRSRDSPCLLIQDGSLPPISIFTFLDSLRDFYFRVTVTVTSIFLLGFSAKVLAPWAHPVWRPRGTAFYSTQEFYKGRSEMWNLTPPTKSTKPISSKSTNLPTKIKPFWG